MRTKGLMRGKKPKITLADDAMAKDLEREIEVIMRVMGHPGALVTDESTMWHFIDMFANEREKKATLAKAARMLGLKVELKVDDLVVEVARMIRKKNA